MRTATPAHPKLAEKLTILNDRGVGLLARLYNIKKTCSNPESKPAFLSEKSMEPIIKHAVRKFPNISDYKTNSTIQVLTQCKDNILKSLTLYYNTFVDLMEYKDHVCELLTTMDACQLTLDIRFNHDLTKHYLDLVVSYVSVMVLMSRVDDRKAALSLYNIAFDMTHGHTDTSFPRLGQMIIDFENPLKKLSEEFFPHSRLLQQALTSLKIFFESRNKTADDWRNDQLFSLVANSEAMLQPIVDEFAQCRYMSIDAMERYIIFGFLLLHQLWNQVELQQLFLGALKCGWVTPLFRDETIYTHHFVQHFFESQKGDNKKISKVKETFNFVIQNSVHIHRERRKYLRTALKELVLLFSDKPGLLGPKALFVFMALSYARDEVYWLLRHAANLPQTNKAKYSAEDLVDRQLPELLFYIEELRGLVRKYSQVLQIYFIQYLHSFDAHHLKDISEATAAMPEEDSLLLDSTYANISTIHESQTKTKVFDFRPLRLDWFRLQAYTSVSRYPFQLVTDLSPLAVCMNSIVYHTKMVDYLDQLLNETSDLSIFCFCNQAFEEQFKYCLEFPAQTRYIIAFPLICGHFLNCSHELCPEERYFFGERSTSLVNLFLEEMSKEARNIITTICNEHCLMSDLLTPKYAKMFMKESKNFKTKGARGGGAVNGTSGAASAGGTPGKGTDVLNRPGSESYRRTREELTTMDKLHMALTELCYAINHSSTICVWDYTFCPREYFTQSLEHRFTKSLVNMTMYNEQTREIAKPSEFLVSVRAYMNVLQSIESYVHIDITRVFNSVLLQQTQALDAHNDKTVTNLYTNWYLEVFLRKVASGHIIYSPRQKAFVSLLIDTQMPFSAEEFSDLNELRALVETIGSYGIDYLNDKIMWHIASQISELKRIVIMNEGVLKDLRSRYDQPEKMRELFKKLNSVESFLQRMSIIGEMMCFRSLIQEALESVLEERIPFLLGSIKDFHHAANNLMIDSMKISPESLKVVDEMACCAGVSCRVDPALVKALRNTLKTTSTGTKPELVHHEDEQYEYACLLMVFIAVSLQKFARVENSNYRPDYEAHANNIHCLAKAINGIAGALFTLTKRNDIEDRLKEFLALASSTLLRLGQEKEDKEAVRNRESVYILLDLIVQESPFLTMDLLESCFPYALIRNAYHEVYKQLSNRH